MQIFVVLLYHYVLFGSSTRLIQIWDVRVFFVIFFNTTGSTKPLCVYLKDLTVTAPYYVLEGPAHSVLQPLSCAGTHADQYYVPLLLTIM